MIKQSAVPTNRFSRMLKLGKMASGVAGGALSEGVKRLARGEIPSASEMLLTPGNARRITQQLSEMRGAVMKIGQLLSMEAGDLLPSELTEILSKLRESAHAMPEADIEATLQQAWGADWRQQFSQFNEQPFAAASIGQVHDAVDRQGRRLAIKVQYPGINKSIDSDVNNAASILRMFKLIPESLDIEPLLETAKAQLHDEANYQLEADYLKLYRQRLGQDEVFEVPQVIDELTTDKVLVMTYIEGGGIEALAQSNPALRDQLATKIIELSLREFLHWGMVQTDPNFANFRFNSDENTVGLLDFGALRVNEAERTKVFTELLQSAMEQDLVKVVNAACAVGYIEKDDPFNYRLAIADLIQTAVEPALHEGEYDFAHSSLSQRMTEKLYKLRSQKGFQRLPPVDIIFLHRKLAGIYMLCAKINARVNVRARIQDLFSQNLLHVPV